jgi:hypothetical protein
MASFILQEDDHFTRNFTKGFLPIRMDENYNEFYMQIKVFIKLTDSYRIKKQLLMIQYLVPKTLVEYLCQILILNRMNLNHSLLLLLLLMRKNF